MSKRLADDVPKSSVEIIVSEARGARVTALRDAVKVEVSKGPDLVAPRRSPHRGAGPEAGPTPARSEQARSLSE